MENLEECGRKPGWASWASLKYQKDPLWETLGGFWSYPPATTATSHLQTAPQSSHVLQNTHQPVRNMTESSTSSLYRVSHDMHGASAGKGWRALLARSLLAAELDSGTSQWSCWCPWVAWTPLVHGKHQGLGVVHLGSCPGCACFLFAKSSTLDFPVQQWFQDLMRSGAWKSAVVQQNVSTDFCWESVHTISIPIKAGCGV